MEHLSKKSEHLLVWLGLSLGAAAHITGCAAQAGDEFSSDGEGSVQADSYYLAGNAEPLTVAWYGKTDAGALCPPYYGDEALVTEPLAYTVGIAAGSADGCGHLGTLSIKDGVGFQTFSFFFEPETPLGSLVQKFGLAQYTVAETRWDKPMSSPWTETLYDHVVYNGFSKNVHVAINDARLEFNGSGLTSGWVDVVYTVYPSETAQQDGCHREYIQFRYRISLSDGGNNYVAPPEANSGLCYEESF